MRLKCCFNCVHALDAHALIINWRARACLMLVRAIYDACDVVCVSLARPNGLTNIVTVDHLHGWMP